MSLQLYALGEMYLNVVDMIDDELPDQDVLNALTTIEGQVEAKAGNIVNLIKSLEWETEAIKAEEKRLALRRKSRENTIDRVKEYLQETMTQMGIDKIKTPTRTISIQNNPPAVQIIDEDAIPGKFLILIPEHYIADKKAIAAALKVGEEVKGAELSAGKSLRIR